MSKIPIMYLTGVAVEVKNVLAASGLASTVTSDVNFVVTSVVASNVASVVASRKLLAKSFAELKLASN
jgi:hypothetical protein